MAAPTFAQSRFSGNGEWAEIAQDAVRDRLRSQNRVWEQREREKIRNESHSRSSSKIDVNDSLTSIGISFIAGAVLGPQANRLENQRDWNEAVVDDWRDTGRSGRKIQEGWARTDQSIVRDQVKHSQKMEKELLDSNQDAYRMYIRNLPEGQVPMTFQQFLGSGHSAMPQMVEPVPVIVNRPITTRPGTSTPGTIVPIGVSLGGSSVKIASAEETQRRYAR